MARNNRKNGIIVFILIVIIALSAAGIGIYESGCYPTNQTGNPDLPPAQKRSLLKDAAEALPGSPLKKQYIAALYIEGEIQDDGESYNQEWLLSTIDALASDPNNKAVILYIDSPGGGVYQSDEAYLALCDYKKTGKKVYAYMGPLAASGGYYIACAADKIYANRNTLTGSIGVIAAQAVDLTGLMQKLGIKSETITAGKNKDMLNYDAPLTAEQRSIMQAVADEAYEQFTGIVAKSRHMKQPDVKKLADGRIYTAQQALKNGLIDHIGTWDNAEQSLADSIGNSSCKVVTYQYTRSQSLISMLLGSISHIQDSRAAARSLLPDAVLKQIKPDVSYPAYLYNGNR